MFTSLSDETNFPSRKLSSHCIKLEGNYSINDMQVEKITEESEDSLLSLEDIKSNNIKE